MTVYLTLSEGGFRRPCHRERTSRGGVFAAEEGLIEGVDAGVEGGDISAHFLADFSQVPAQVLVSGVQLLAELHIAFAIGSPEGKTRPLNCDDDGDGVRVHEGFSITWSRLAPRGRGYRLFSKPPTTSSPSTISGLAGPKSEVLEYAGGKARGRC